MSSLTYDTCGAPAQAVSDRTLSASAAVAPQRESATIRVSMAKREITPNVDVSRIEAQLTIARKALADLEAVAAQLPALQTEITELETRLARARDVEDDAAVDIEALIMRAAAVTGEITSTGVRAHVPTMPPHTIERAIGRLVAARRLVETEDTGRPTLGRGRSPRVYAVTGVTSETERVVERRG
ncbi:MAG: hypothetical protein IPH07_24160 [Deltaproteobacteria bacterium]|nr:hypothetical protein [Deltaproteobacteria bacterium]